MDWNADLASLVNPGAPSAAQLASALHDTAFDIADVPILPLADLARRVRV